jgi:hypothetical protein
MLLTIVNISGGKSMLNKAMVVTTIPIVDIPRAKEFYQDKLELNLLQEMEDGLIFEAGNETKLYLYKRPGTKADHTIASFEVNDVVSEVQHLKTKGVVFEEYDTPDLKTENSIHYTEHYKSAWFKDTEGNILAINQMD